MIRSADRVIDYTAGDSTKDDQEYEAAFDAVGRARSAGAGGC